MTDAIALVAEARQSGLIIRLRGADLRVIGLGALAADRAATWRDRIRSGKVRHH